MVAFNVDTMEFHVVYDGEDDNFYFKLVDDIRNGDLVLII